MQLDQQQHLTYCTNIHPGESWPAVLTSLEQYLLPVKEQLSPEAPFGIGLRLSNRASEELGTAGHLQQFRHWLERHDCYVFTLNGFPYGGFHRERVKDQVHQPDWTTRQRVDYTIRLFRQLAALLPAGQEGGISTSPLSYRPWFPSKAQQEQALSVATLNLLEVIGHLHLLEQHTGQYLHLDMEPEPDGFLSTSDDAIEYVNRWLLPEGIRHFAGRLSPGDAEAAIRRHFTICYDVCHFAVEFEDAREVLKRFRENGIRIGKMQISAALRAVLPAEAEARQALLRQLETFDESVYLHQAVIRNDQGQLTHFPDLGPALSELRAPQARECRTHFHVPVFLDRYQLLQSTQSDILESLELQLREPFTNHLEVETYTWEVLPREMQTDLVSSIVRELRWVQERLRSEHKPSDNP